MERFWGWWWKQRAGDSSDSVLFKPRFDEALKALRFLLLKAFRLIEPRFVLFVSLAAFIAATIVAWNIPVFHRIWGDEFWDAKNGQGVRDLVLAATTLVGALIGLAGYLLLAVRTNAIQRQTDLQREAQITDRFTKAVEQLGHDKIAVRLGAIYALERIAKDSELDFETIMETLAAYVRENAPWAGGEGARDNVPPSDDDNIKPAIDIAAAISVLARTIPREHVMRRRGHPARIDLRHVDLSGIDMPGAQLSGFRFDGSCFYRADLSRAKFVHADLSSANFDKARMWLVDLTDTEMWNARLNHAYLADAKFNGAQMMGIELNDAYLMDASFCGADLSYAELRNAALLRADFSGSDLSGGDLENASLAFSNLADVILDGADVSGVVFRGASGLEDGTLNSAEYLKTNPPKNVPEGIELPALVLP